MDVVKTESRQKSKEKLHLKARTRLPKEYLAMIIDDIKSIKSKYSWLILQTNYKAFFNHEVQTDYMRCIEKPQLSTCEVKSFLWGAFLSSISQSLSPLVGSLNNYCNTKQIDSLYELLQNHLSLLQRRVRSRSLSKQRFYRLTTVIVLTLENLQKVSRQDNLSAHLKLLIEYLFRQIPLLFEKKPFQDVKGFQKEIQIAREVIEALKKESFINQTFLRQSSNDQMQTEKCQICMFPQTSLDSFCFPQCGHSFHYQCLQDYYNSQIHEFQTELKCPSEQCQIQQKSIDYKSLHQIFQYSNGFEQQKENQQLLSKFYDFRVERHIAQNLKSDFSPSSIEEEKFDSASNRFFYCLTPGCNAIYQDDGKEGKKENSFICLSCRKQYCLSCWKPIHSRMTCVENEVNNKETKEDLYFKEYLKEKGKKYKKCPGCNFWVDNWRGCSTIKCRCGTEFCYKCGQRGCPHGKCLNIPPPT